MTYLRSQSQYGAALGPEREQAVKVIFNAFGVNPAFAAKCEGDIAKLMHRKLGTNPRCAGNSKPPNEMTKERTERVIAFCTVWRTGREIMDALDLTSNHWDTTRRYCNDEGLLEKRGKNNATEYRAAP